MESKKYWTLLLSNVSRDEEDILSGRLFELGAEGVHENLNFQGENIGYLPEIIESPYIELRAYFSECLSPERVASLELEFPGTQAHIDSQTSEDWLAKWKESWTPFQFAGNFWIFPTWTPIEPEESRQIIQIDPGMAFGTGTHPTTQLCGQLALCLLEFHLPTRVLDLGTGSGILSILLSKAGVTQIKAYDNDPDVRPVFDSNLVQNRIDNVAWSENWCQEPGAFDCIMVNIIDGIILDLKNSIRESLGSAGHIVVSGILSEREAHFKKEFLEGWSLTEKMRVEQGDWVGYWFQRDL